MDGGGTFDFRFGFFAFSVIVKTNTSSIQSFSKTGEPDIKGAKRFGTLHFATANANKAYRGMDAAHLCEFAAKKSCLRRAGR